MAAIGYEWGSYNHMRPADKSPDEHMNRDVASAMSRVGGGFRGEKEYRTGMLLAVHSTCNLDRTLQAP